MLNDRLSQSDAEQRLDRFPTLAFILGRNWLAQEYKKPIRQWSLITGWVNKIDDPIFGDQFEKWLKDLDAALAFLKPQLPIAAWRKIEHKIRVHSDRANFKGTLSEMAMLRFLANNPFRLDLETKLNPKSGKDVDIRAFMPDSTVLHIEVQWLSPSESSERGAAIASAYGKAYPIDYDKEKQRVKCKIYDKTPKFTQEDITIVALDCTSSPELGGGNRYSIVEEAMYEACMGQSRQGVPTGREDCKVDETIRGYVDGAVWFELTHDNALLPQQRGAYINSKSPNQGTIERSAFVEAWLATY